MKKTYNTTELFCGLKSFSTVMAAHGHNTWTTDIENKFDPDERANVMSLFDDLRGNTYDHVDILWASPPCQGFSVAAIGRNWNFDNTPKTDAARLAMKLARKTLRIIKATESTWWFIENPRGMLRKMKWMEEFLTEQGGGTERNKLLPIRRRANETDRYLDQRFLVDAKENLQEWNAVSCIRTTRRSYWNARTEGRSRTRSYSCCVIRGNPLANAKMI